MISPRSLKRSIASGYPRTESENEQSRTIKQTITLCISRACRAGQFIGVKRSRRDARGTLYPRKRSWRPCRVCSRMGVARRHRDRLSTKVRPHVRNRRGWRVIRRPCSLERSTLGVSVVFSKKRSPRSPIPGSPTREIGRSRDRGYARGVRARAGRFATNAGAKIQVRGWTIEIYRSAARVRARADDIARRRAAWKFYQYRGGHLVSLAVAREKLRAERRTTERGCRRASRSTNRRGLPEQKEPEATDCEQHVSTRDDNARKRSVGSPRGGPREDAPTIRHP